MPPNAVDGGSDDSPRSPRGRFRRLNLRCRAGRPFSGRCAGTADSGGTAHAAAGGEKIWHEAACALRGRPQSVKLARDFARETLAAWGLPDLCDDVTWVISELVTNALNHGLPHSSQARWARPIRLCLTMQLAQVLCTVSDPGRARRCSVNRTTGAKAAGGCRWLTPAATGGAGTRWTVAARSSGPHSASMAEQRAELSCRGGPS